MTEFEELQVDSPYYFMDPAIEAIRKEAFRKCRALDTIDILDTEGRTAAVKDFFGTIDENILVFPNLNCDNGKNIHVGKQFLTSYNGIILDVAEVRIGYHVMVGPSAIITTVNQQGRYDNISVAKPIVIGSDVWIGGNVTVPPGMTTGNNVVVAAGAVVTKDIPDNRAVADVPAKVTKTVGNDID